MINFAYAEHNLFSEIYLGFTEDAIAYWQDCDSDLIGQLLTY